MTTAVHPRERTACPQPNATDLRIVGHDLTVPLVTGGLRRYANLDHAASAPCLVAVKDAVDALLPWYSSVHRGAGSRPGSRRPPARVPATPCSTSSGPARTTPWGWPRPPTTWTGSSTR